MHLDARGLPLSTASANAASAYDHLITGYLIQRADTPARLTALLEADPDFALAHCMQGLFATLALGQIQALRYARNLVYKVDRETVGHHFNNIHRPRNSFEY
jgi:hypothetical protein